GDAIAIRQRYVTGNPFPGFSDRRAEIAAADAEFDGYEPRVALMKDVGSAGIDRDVGDLAQANVSINPARCREPDLDPANRIEGAAVFGRKSDRHVELAVRL